MYPLVDRAILLLVPMTLLVTFYVFPNLLNLGFAFSDWNTFRDQINFIGLGNFESLARDGTLWRDLRITLVYGASVALFQNVFGLGLALGLESPTRWNRFLRSGFFLPVFISALAVGFIFHVILGYEGVLNATLSTVLRSKVQIEWLGSVDWTVILVAFIHAWKWTGLTMLIYIAGLAAIPPELIEAARIDGAGRWRLFQRIKFPLLAPAFTVNIVITLIGALNTADVVVATTAGGPAASTEVLNYYIFKEFGRGYLGSATAMSLVLFLAVVLVAVPLLVYLRRREVAL